MFYWTRIITTSSEIGERELVVVVFGLIITSIITRMMLKCTFITNIAVFPSAELFKMVCEDRETDLNISIPAVMLPQDAGTILEDDLKNNSRGMLPLFCLYLTLPLQCLELENINL